MKCRGYRYFRFVPYGTRTSCLCDVHICIFIENVWDVQNTLPNYIRTNTCSKKVCMYGVLSFIGSKLPILSGLKDSVYVR